MLKYQYRESSLVQNKTSSLVLLHYEYMEGRTEENATVSASLEKYLLLYVLFRHLIILACPAQGLTATMSCPILVWYFKRGVARGF